MQKSTWSPPVWWPEPGNIETIFNHCQRPPFRRCDQGANYNVWTVRLSTQRLWKCVWRGIGL